MYDKICVVCGKPFQAPNPRYIVCSDECRKVRSRYLQHKKAKNRYEREKAHRQKYDRERYTPVVKFCHSCGDVLPDGRQTFCLRCLVNDFMHGDYEHRRSAYRRLALRGYTKVDIISEAESLNLV